MQRGSDKFERRDPLPHIPFENDEFYDTPSLSEVVGWMILGACFMSALFGFLVAA